MCAFVVLGLVFHTKPRDWIGECVRNDLFCVEWDVKHNSINHRTIMICWLNELRTANIINMLYLTGAILHCARERVQ